MKRIYLVLCICMFLFVGCQKIAENKEPISKMEVKKIVAQTKSLAFLTKNIATVLDNSNVISEDDYENIHKIASIVYVTSKNTEEVIASLDEEDTSVFINNIVERFNVLINELSDLNAISENDVDKIEKISKEINMFLAMYMETE